MTEKAGTSTSVRPATLVGCLILVLASTWWSVGSLLSIEEEVSTTDLKYLLPVIVGVVLMECLLVALIAVVSRRVPAIVAATAVLMIANAVSLNLIMSPGFVTANQAILAVSLLAGGFVAFTLVKMAVESAVLRILISFGLVVLTGIPVVSALLSRFEADNTPSGNPSRIVKNVDFVQKPNVYFIGFESMAPQAVLSRYLGYDDSPLLAAFERLGFRVFRNVFAEQVPTRNSLAQLLLLDSETYANAGSDRGLAFSGNYPSTLIEIFRHNGYETNTLYPNTFFGAKGGPWVDHYRVNSNFSVCTFMDPTEKAYAFFGACRLYERTAWQSTGKVPGLPIDFFLREMAQLAKSEKPQFLLAHTWQPTHTRGDFAGTDAEIVEFREAYRKASIKAAANLDKIVDLVRKYDPKALLFVFGDHGIYLSRKSSDEVFIVQDTHAVAGAVYPSTACAESFDDPIDRDFVTTPQVARMIIRCLAGGTDAFDPSYKHKLTIGEKTLDFADFLYE